MIDSNKQTSKSSLPKEGVGGKLVFATNNQHKLQEIRHILGDSIEVLSLSDIGCNADIPETGTTLEENARQKAEYIWQHYHCDVFADDTGLEVDALGGAPGVYSARYAGEGHDSEANMAKLLHELGDSNNRKARFRTVIALIQKKNVCPCGCTSIKQEHLFEGIVEGEITRERSGAGGFGYDPIFQPEGYTQTFADMGENEKNLISHRARATKKLCDFLLKLFILFICLPLNAQIGTWQNYMSYYEPQQIAKADKQLFVRASNSLYSYHLQDHSITTFDKVNVLSDTYITHIAWNAAVGRLIIVYQNSNIDVMDGQQNVVNISALYAKSMTQDKTVNNIYMNDVYAYLATGFGVVKINMQRAEITESYILNENITNIAIDQSTLYARTAQGKVLAGSQSANLIDKGNWQAVTVSNHQLFKEDTADWDDYIETVRTLQPGGPKYNYFGFMKFYHDRLYTCGGGYSVVQDLMRPAALQMMDPDKDWTYYPENIGDLTGHSYLNLNCLDIDPTNEHHLFTSGRTGLYEFTDTNFTQHYNFDNSPLQAVIANNKNYVILQGIRFDSKGNLWCLNGYHPEANIMLLKPSGEWETHYQESLLVNNTAMPNLTKPFFDSRGLLWFLNDSYVNPSVCCYDPVSDKAYRMSDIVNQDGVKTVVESIHDIAEDKEHNIWVGTNNGLFVIYESDITNIPSVTFNQVKVPRNDGTNYADYLLDGVDISGLAIDGGNRKWVITNGNGAYLISADNLEQLHHFTTDNSYLLSNNVESIAINDKTGEVFFGTENGLCSYISDATETTDGEVSSDDIYAYPNPAAHYDGLITINGFSFDADVKIVTASGKLIAQGRSNGGTFTWDGRDSQGRRVASGVYTAISTTRDGKKSGLCRIAIIN